MVLVIGGAFQNKLEWSKSHFSEREIWNNFHQYIKDNLEKGISSEKIRKSVFDKINQNSSIIIVSDEIGCGVVPFSENDRNYRELTGRLLCEIAEKAENVFRITCGIGQKIK